jgi:hypothetical protein
MGIICMALEIWKEYGMELFNSDNWNHRDEEFLLRQEYYKLSLVFVQILINTLYNRLIHKLIVLSKNCIYSSILLSHFYLFLPGYFLLLPGMLNVQRPGARAVNSYQVNMALKRCPRHS